MNKRGQISIFVIFAIIIIAMLIIYFSVKDNLVNKKIINPEIEQIYNYVDNCLEKTAEDSIYIIGQNGGYFNYAEKSNEVGIPYYLYDEENLMPSKERVEKEIEEYVNEMIFFCTKNFADFPDYEIRAGKIKSKIDIKEDEAFFNLNYPLSIKKGENNFVIDNFNKKVNSRLGVIYKTAEAIMEEQILDKKNICINCIGDIAYDNNVVVSMNDYDERTIIFSVRDNEIGLKGEEYVYYFANRYNL